MKTTFKTYWPELLAIVLLIAYSLFRALLVAQGISSVSSVSWKFFLFLELITTPPYVWGIGNIARTHLKRKRITKKYLIAWVVVILCFSSPYLYLLLGGAFSSIQGTIATIILLLIAIVSVILKNMFNRTTK